MNQQDGSITAVQEPTDGWPRWLKEIDLALPICSQFVLYGNIHDSHLVPVDDKFEAILLVQSLWERLRRRGFGFLFVFDPNEGLRVHPKSADEAAQDILNAVRTSLGESPSGDQAIAPKRPNNNDRNVPDFKRRPEVIPEAIRSIDASTSVRCGLVVENASRLVLSPGNISEAELQIFSACERLARIATPRQPTGGGGQPLFNAVFWLANRIRDLPDWFVVGNERVRPISVPWPDYEARRTFAQRLAPSIDRNATSAADSSKQVDQFAALTEGLSLRSIQAVARLARDQGHLLKDIGNAIRCYKIGVPDDPWAKPHLRESIRHGEEEFRKWVKGQDFAISKTVDILTRSVMGLSGSQAASSVSRPRGVLFFAGPTGVGKTELAKAISRLIFGDAQACIRFDMSEFSSEHSDARLIGAPPGYVGYDTGGELVNAVRQRPFSVLLFDEIEKAHPRILDKFLQVLEDGRLTDGRGDTVHFSETVIVFTSNLGMFVEKERMTDDGFGRSAVIRERVRVFDPKEPPPYNVLKEKIQSAIGEHFRSRLERPELLNRIGDNIVVFDFIRDTIAEQIFDKAISAVIARVAEVNGVEVILETGVREKLLELCTVDLSHGGRGIGNRLETAFINPLARILFNRDAGPGSKVSVSDLTSDEVGHVVLICT